MISAIHALSPLTAIPKADFLSEPSASSVKGVNDAYPEWWSQSWDFSYVAKFKLLGCCPARERLKAKGPMHRLVSC